jgi:hypothetical protein
MPARVNINIPPRVIESARAAQYANREALDGRVLTDKIKAKVQARRAAVLRQQPRAVPDRGDDSPPAQDPLKWRIWRKRRPLGRRITYTIEGMRQFYSYTTGPVYKSIIDQWTIYAEWEGYEKKIWLRLFSVDNVNDEAFAATRSAMYISTFVGDDESPPLISLLSYIDSGTVDPPPGEESNGVAWAFTLEDPIPFDEFPETVPDGYNRLFNPALVPASETNLLSDKYNPLHAWTPGSFDEEPLFRFIYGTTRSNPFANEYDTSRIELFPGYIKTSSVELTEQRTYSVSTTVKP